MESIGIVCLLGIAHMAAVQMLSGPRRLRNLCQSRVLKKAVLRWGVFLGSLNILVYLIYMYALDQGIHIIEISSFLGWKINDTDAFNANLGPVVPTVLHQVALAIPSRRKQGGRDLWTQMTMLARVVWDRAEADLEQRRCDWLVLETQRLLERGTHDWAYLRDLYGRAVAPYEDKGSRNGQPHDFVKRLSAIMQRAEEEEDAGRGSAGFLVFYTIAEELGLNRLKVLLGTPRIQVAKADRHEQTSEVRGSEATIPPHLPPLGDESSPGDDSSSARTGVRRTR